MSTPQRRLPVKKRHVETEPALPPKKRAAHYDDDDADADTTPTRTIRTCRRVGYNPRRKKLFHYAPTVVAKLVETKEMGPGQVRTYQLPDGGRFVVTKYQSEPDVCFLFRVRRVLHQARSCVLPPPLRTSVPPRIEFNPAMLFPEPVEEPPMKLVAAVRNANGDVKVTYELEGAPLTRYTVTVYDYEPALCLAWRLYRAVQRGRLNEGG